MRKVGNEVPLGSLLLSEGIWVDVPLLSKIIVESGLAGEFTPIDLLGPEGVLAQMLPRDPLHWVLLQQPAQQIREQWRSSRDWLIWSGLNLCDQLLQSTGFKWRQAGCHFVENAAEGPDVRLETVNAFFVEKLRGHVVRGAIFALWSVFTILCGLLLVLIIFVIVRQV